MDEQLQFKSLSIRPDLSLGYIGPDVSAGPLPALFYLALSAEESLCLDPYNQPVFYLASLPMRIFSMTLPAHGTELPATQALFVWAQELARGHDLITAFADQMHVAIEALLHRGICMKEKIGIAGLSRGAFLALHAAIKVPQVRTILSFAPLTKISHGKEFQEIAHDSLVQSLDLEHFVDALAERTLRFYIGNLDVRVGTRHCFNLVEKLSQAAFEKRVRSPQIELIISPSIGHQGHGTPKAIFHHGAQWIVEKLGAIDVL